MVFQLNDPGFLANPAPQLAQMRAQGAAVRTYVPLIGTVWVTTTDAAARKVLKDPDRFAHDPTRAGRRTLAAHFWWLPRFLRPLLHNILSVDGAEHARLRGAVDAAFARQVTDAQRPRLANLADSLLDRIEAGQTTVDQPIDLIAAYALPLPLITICDLLGIPPADHAKITRWIAPISGPTNALTMLIALPGLWRLMRHFRADFADVLTHRRPGLIDDLIHADDHRLSDDELLTIVVTLFAVGHETTVHLIGNAITALASNPDSRARLAADPAKLPPAVEEFLRFYTPVMLTKPQFVTQDTMLEGVAMKRGDKVLALLIGANHDPQRFEMPHELQTDRRPNPHLGFGFGPHVCLGMQLARAETEIALARLLARFPDMTLAAPPIPARRFGIRGVEKVLVRLRP